MMDRHAYEDDLKAYADGELPLLRRIAVARHLARCAACRMEVAQMSQITEELRPDTHEALDPTLRAKILADLGAPSPSPVRAPKRRLKIAPLIGATAAMGVLAYAFAPQLSQLIPPTGEKMAAYAPAAGVRQLGLASFQYMQDTDERVSGAASDKSGVILHIKNPDSRYMDVNGGVHNSLSPLVSSVRGYAPAHHAMTSQSGIPNGAATADTAGNFLTAGRQVHNEATIGVQVANAETASGDLEALVKGVGGYVAQNSLTSDGDGKRSADITIKVPVDQFASVMTQIGKFGKVTDKSVTGEDITEKTSDADQTEQVMEDEVHRNDAALKARGKRATWRDQEQARELRIQLAESRARLGLLRKMARLSNIEVTLTEKTKEPTKVTSNFWTGLTASTGAATDSLAAAFGRVLALVIWIVAYAPLWVPMALGYRWWAKKNKREETAA